MKLYDWFAAFAVSTPLALISAVLALFAVSNPTIDPTKVTASTGPQIIIANTRYLQAYQPEIPQIEAGLISGDRRSQIIKKYLHEYQSPLTPFADTLVAISDKYSVDPYLIVGIAQQESNLCKIIPDKSHNCWGYGIYGDKVTRFENYPQALETVISGIRKNYIEKGLVTPEQIMRKYTPPSVAIGGPWARGVSQFIANLDQ